MKNKAFTLIELLVVISIISLLSSVVLSSLNSARAKSAVGAGQVHSHTVTASLGDSEAARWDFDDCGTGSIVRDLSGNGNNATAIGSPIFPTDTYNGRGCAMSSSAGPQYAQAPDTASLDVTVPITISAWFRKTSTPASWGLIVSKEGSYQLMSSAAGETSKGQFALNISGVWQRLSTVTSFNLNQWYFIVATYDGAAQRIYVNGSLDSSRAQTGTPGVNANAVDLGAGIACGNCYHLGQIDEVHIYTRNLTSMEIKDAYLAGAAKKGIAIVE